MFLIILVFIASFLPRMKLKNIYDNTKTSSPPQGEIHNVCILNKISRYAKMPENTTHNEKKIQPMATELEHTHVRISRPRH